jgi:hypothetical protein
MELWQLRKRGGGERENSRQRGGGISWRRVEQRGIKLQRE